MAFIPYIKASLRKNVYTLDDKYVINDGKTHPFAILLPGGGYSVVYSYGEGDPIAKKLNENGISAFILYYGVKKKARYPKPIDDCARAIRYIIDNKDKYNVDINNYSLWGASAGGHLAACMGTNTLGCINYNLPRPNCLILIYPVVTLGKYAHKGSKHKFLGFFPTVEEIEKGSVQMHIDNEYPATYIWCGDSDKSVNPINAKILKDSLDEKNVKNKLDIFPGIGHGVGLATGTVAEPWFNNALNFWLKGGE